MINVVFVASEAAPFAKTGGLADVAGSLPKALNQGTIDGEPINVKVFMPLHVKINPNFRNQMTYLGYTTVNMGWRNQYVGLLTLNHEGVDFYFIDNEFYFKRHALYGDGDDAERYIFFSKSVLAALKMIDLKPEIIHTNDWHAASVNVLLDYYRKHDPFYQGIKTVFTIHNLRYQGVFDPYIMGDLLNLPYEYYHEERLKFYENINILKGGIVFSDHITTVSKTYAHEITFPYFGENLDGIINKYSHKLTGIVNGIDYDVYAPETDQNLPVHYNIADPAGKKEIKQKVQERFGLPINPDVPMLSIISRLADMKGLDLVQHILDELLTLDIQLVVLGTGEKRYEDLFKHYQYMYPNKLSARIFFDQHESHLIYAASDIFLMPSLFEPCGLSQLIALRYGTIPVVRQIGGLKDTVIPYNKYTGEGTGFGFMNYNAHELLFTIKEALDYFKDPVVWPKLMSQAMQADHSWETSSKEYLSVYASLLGKA